jgi:hypothetical protein
MRRDVPLLQYSKTQSLKTSQRETRKRYIIEVQKQITLEPARMSADTTSTGNIVILKTQSDWESWLTYVRHQVTDTVWMDYLDPDSDKVPPTVRVNPPPAVQDFSQVYRDAHARWTQEHQAWTQSEREDEEPDEPSPAHATLTTNEAKDFDRAFRSYQASFNHNNGIEAALKDCGKLILKTTSIDAQQLFEHSDNVRTKMKKLKQNYGRSKEDARRAARHRYEQAIKLPRRSMDAAKKWLSEWQGAMAEGTRYKIPEIDDPQDFSRHVADALGWTFPDAVGLLRLLPHTFVNPPARSIKDVTYLQVVHAVQRMWTDHPLRLNQSAKRTAFAASLAPDSETQELVESVDRGAGQNTVGDRLASNEHAQKPRVRKERQLKRQRTDKHEETACKACGMGNHDLFNCWFVNPAVRPETWAPTFATKAGRHFKEHKHDALVKEAIAVCTKHHKVLSDE